MGNEGKFYIGGRWVEPAGTGADIIVVNPATEEVVGRVAAGSAADVDAASPPRILPSIPLAAPRVRSASLCLVGCWRRTSAVHSRSPRP